MLEPYDPVRSCAHEARPGTLYKFSYSALLKFENSLHILLHSSCSASAPAMDAKQSRRFHCANKDRLCKFSLLSIYVYVAHRWAVRQRSVALSVR